MFMKNIVGQNLTEIDLWKVEPPTYSKVHEHCGECKNSDTHNLRVEFTLTMWLYFVSEIYKDCALKWPFMSERAALHGEI